MKTYENYWKLTNAFTDYNGEKFLQTLSVCIDLIDETKSETYTSEKYEMLQMRLRDALNIGEVSVRKAINQLVKMGFLNTFLVSYHNESRNYVEARTNKKRQILFSKIIYSNASFNRAVNEESNLRQINFLVQTLIEKGVLSKDEIIALMTVDIASVPKGYLNAQELKYYVQRAEQTGFVKRKYNQVGYLFNLLKKLEDLTFVKDNLYFTEDAKRIFGDDFQFSEVRKRDAYLHRLYKNQLKDECETILGDAKCMVENLAYPVLIASHIKPFIFSDDDEAYDVNNGFLLSKNIDSLFDLGYITFDDGGNVISVTALDSDVRTFVKQYKLNASFLNDQRKQYLKYHRENVFGKRFRSE